MASAPAQIAIHGYLADISDGIINDTAGPEEQEYVHTNRAVFRHQRGLKRISKSQDEGHRRDTKHIISVLHIYIHNFGEQPKRQEAIGDSKSQSASIITIDAYIVE